MFSDVEGEASSEWIGFVDPNEPRYCLCNQVSKYAGRLPKRVDFREIQYIPFIRACAYIV